MIALLLAATAWADPVALRAPVAAPGVTLGWHELSAAVPLPDGWWLAPEVRTTGSALGASTGRRWTLARGPKGWGVDATAAVGLLATTATPGVALEVTPALIGGWWGERFAVTADLAVPVAGGWARTWQLRVPGLLELQTGGALGPLWIGARLGMGAAWTPGLDTSVVLEPALWLAWAPGQPISGMSQSL